MGKNGICKEANMCLTKAKRHDKIYKLSPMRPCGTRYKRVRGNEAE